MASPAPTLIIITGASKGFGRGVAVEFAKALSQPLHFVLTGRNALLLGETKAMVQASRMAGALTTFDVYAADLGDLSTIKATADRLFLLATKASLTSAVTYDRVIFINNAGSLGPLTYVGTPAVDPATYLAHMTSAFGFNVTSSSYLTAELTRRFSTNLVDATSVAIINISSLAAVQPFESWGIYCAGKAAREMFHKTVAAEQKDKATFRVLNYAPGPLDTDMQREIREGPHVDPTTQATFVEMKANNQLVTVNDSALKLVRLVWQEKYASGAHVDYFDVVPDMCNDVKCTCGALCGCGADCTCGGGGTAKAKAAPAAAPAASVSSCGCTAGNCTCCVGCKTGGACICTPGNCNCCSKCPAKATTSAAKGSCCGGSATAGASSCGCTAGNCTCCVGCKTGGACICTPGNCNCCSKCQTKLDAQQKLDEAAVAALRRNNPSKAVKAEEKPAKDSKKAAKTEEKPAKKEAEKDSKKAAKTEEKPVKEAVKEGKKATKTEEKPAKKEEKAKDSKKAAKIEEKPAKKEEKAKAAKGDKPKKGKEEAAPKKAEKGKGKK